MGNLGGFFEFLEKNNSSECSELVDRIIDVPYTSVVIGPVADYVWFEQVVYGGNNERVS